MYTRVRGEARGTNCAIRISRLVDSSTLVRARWRMNLKIAEVPRDSRLFRDICSRGGRCFASQGNNFNSAGKLGLGYSEASGGKGIGPALGNALGILLNTFQRRDYRRS